jgi:ribosome-associated protein
LVHPAPGVRPAHQKEDIVLSPNAEAAVSADDRAEVSTARPLLTSQNLLADILSSLDDDKAEEVVQVDLRGRSSIGDYMVIASGRSTRQVAAMAEHLLERLKRDFGINAKVEGKEIGDWVLLDTGDVIVHLFRPEVREFYQLEKMWVPQAPAQG